MTSRGPWRFETRRGSAADLHGLVAVDQTEPLVRRLVVERHAVVLGSTQPEGMIDEPAARGAGIEVCRRRSGGGLVAIDPASTTWLDVIVPVGHRLWSDDVGRAFHPIGEAFALALADLGVDGATVHTGRAIDAAWGRIVCFAGLGAGEVTLGGAKIVGLSQRRTRAGATFQALVTAPWDASSLRTVVVDGGIPTELGQALPHLAVGDDRLRPFVGDGRENERLPEAYISALERV